jgi:spermidine/putrescine transport system permease protein
MIAPLWVILGGLVLVPLAGVVAVSFSRLDDQTYGIRPADPPEAFDHVWSGRLLDSHRSALERSNLLIAWRSVWMAAVTTATTAAVGYPMAYYIAVRARQRWRPLLLLLAVVPFWTSFLVRTFSWVFILRREGLINGLLMQFGWISEPLDLLYNDWAVLIGLVYGELPFMVLPIYASLERLDRSLLEAADDLGAGGLATFVRVTLPLSLPGVVAGAVLVFVPSLGQFVVSDLLGGGRSDLLGNLIHTHFSGASGGGDAPLGAAMAMQMTAAVLALVALHAGWSRRRKHTDAPTLM